MKLVKLSKNQVLYKQGFRYALQFDYYCNDAIKIDRAVRNTLESGQWGEHFLRRKGNTVRPYWLGFYNEETVTQVLLSCHHENRKT